MKAKPKYTRKEAAPKAGVGQGSPEMRKGSQITVPPEIPRHWVGCYRKLIRMRERLTEERADLVRDAKAPLAPYSMDMADAASDEYEREMEWTEVGSAQELLFEIDEALQRMRSGVYGICERSGKPIPHRRLEAVPWTRFTEEVEEQLEREGVIPRVHLDAARSIQSQDTIPLAASPMESEDREPRMEDLAKLTGAENEDESAEGTEANENSKE